MAGRNEIRLSFSFIISITFNTAECIKCWCPSITELIVLLVRDISLRFPHFQLTVCL